MQLGNKAKYTTNKGILPEVLVTEMRNAFMRCEELLDLELTTEDPMLKQKGDIQDTLQHATTEELGQVLEMIQTLNIGKTNQVKK